MNKLSHTSFPLSTIKKKKKKKKRETNKIKPDTPRNVDTHNHKYIQYILFMQSKKRGLRQPITSRKTYRFAFPPGHMNSVQATEAATSVAKKNMDFPLYMIISIFIANVLQPTFEERKRNKWS